MNRQPTLLRPVSGRVGRAHRVRNALPTCMSALVLSVVVVLLATSAFAVPESSASIAEEVVRLRRNVEELSASLREDRATGRTELVALVSEKEDLKRQVRLERVRHETLAALSRERDLAAAGLQTRLTSWIESARQSVASAVAMVNATAPVHRGQRLATLERIAIGLAGPRPDVSLAFERLWRFLEEEEALSREIAIDQQVFDVDGQKRVLDVARIGLSAMYVRHDDGFVGIVHWSAPDAPAGAETPLVVVERAADKRKESAIRDIFDAVRRGKRETHLLLPAAVLQTRGAR